MIQTISILGSTGSIGTQTLDVVDKLGLRVCALTAANNIELLEKQQILLNDLTYMHLRFPK